MKEQRKIAVWGAGKRGLLLAHSNMRIDFFIDNDIEKKGKTVLGREILHPSDISNWDDIYIYISLIRTYAEAVCKQLEEYGLEAGKDFEIWNDFAMYSLDKCVRDYEEKVADMEQNLNLNENIDKKILYWGAMNHLDTIYTSHFLEVLQENDKCEVISLMQREIAPPFFLSTKLYVDGVEKGISKRGDFVEKEFISQIAEQMEADVQLYDIDSFFVKAYYTYQYVLRVVEKVQPVLIICNDSVNPVHRIVRKIAEIKQIPIIFMHQGVLPGTISFDIEGEVGESLLALYSEKFCKMEITVGEKERAKEVIDFLKHSKLNRKEQPKSNMEEIRARLDVTKKTVFYCGQNDPRSYMVPYTEETRRYYSPVFKSTFDGLCYVAELCEKNGWNLLYKPHPMYVVGAELERLPKNVIFVEKADINDIIDISDAMVTILSSTNYISMIREKPVVMLGYNWTMNNGCTYEAYSKEEIERCIQQALTEGYSIEQKDAFLSHVARCLKYYVYDDMKTRELRYGKKMPEKIDDFFELKHLLACEKENK